MTETIVVPKFSLYLYKQNKFACFIRSYGCQYSVDENENRLIVSGTFDQLENAKKIINNKMRYTNNYEVLRQLNNLVVFDNGHKNTFMTEKMIKKLNSLAKKRFYEIPSLTNHEFHNNMTQLFENDCHIGEHQSTAELLLDEIDYCMSKRSHWICHDRKKGSITKKEPFKCWALTDGEDGQLSNNVDDYYMSRTSKFRNTCDRIANSGGLSNELHVVKQLHANNFTCIECGSKDLKQMGGSSFAWSDIVCKNCHCFYELKTLGERAIQYGSYKNEFKKMNGGSYKYFMQQQLAGVKHYAIVCPKRGGKVKLYKIDNVQPKISSQFIACGKTRYTGKGNDRSFSARLKTVAHLTYVSDLYVTDDCSGRDSDCNSIAAKLLYCRFSKFARIIQRSIKKCIKKKVFKKLRNNRIIQKFNWNVSTTRYDKDHYNIPYSDTCSDTCSDIDTCSDTCSEIDSEYYDEIEYDILNTIQRKRGKCISKKVLSL